MQNELIPKNMYRDLAIQTPLNSVFKLFFSEINSIEDCEQLQVLLYQVREHLLKQHQNIVRKLRENDVIKALGFRLIQDKASSSGGHFLRWRLTLGKQENKGGLLWKGLIQDNQLQVEVKKRILQMEKERITLNMQMSILNSMMRQLSDSIKKLTDIKQEYIHLQGNK